MSKLRSFWSRAIWWIAIWSGCEGGLARSGILSNSRDPIAREAPQFYPYNNSDLSLQHLLHQNWYCQLLHGIHCKRIRGGSLWFDKTHSPLIGIAPTSPIDIRFSQRPSRIAQANPKLWTWPLIVLANTILSRLRKGLTWEIQIDRWSRPRLTDCGSSQFSLRFQCTFLCSLYSRYSTILARKIQEKIWILTSKW